MRIARRMLACMLAASLSCLPIPAVTAMGSPSSNLDGSEVPADGTIEAPSKGSDGPNDLGMPAPNSAPSPTNGPGSSRPDKDVASSASSDSSEGSINSHDDAPAEEDTKAARASDLNPPQLISASVNKTEVGVGDTLTISYDITDADGIKSVSLIIDHPNSGITIRNTTGAHATKYTSTLIQSTTVAGTYKVIGYRVTDDQDHVSSIISKDYEGLSWTDPMYGQIIFESIKVLSYKVTITKDSNSTQFIGASIEQTLCRVGGFVNVSCDIKDADGIEAISLVLLPPSSRVPAPRQGTLTSDGQSVSCPITSSDTAGLYKVIGYRVSDKRGYVSSFIDTAYKTATWASTMYGTCTFMALPSISFLVIDNSKIGSYHILEGADPTIEKGTSESLTFRIDGDLSSFIVATLDGKDIPSSDYDLESGSTVITLKPSYLNSLQPGTNEFAAWYNDGGNAATTIRVLGKDDEPTASPDPEETDADTSAGNDAGESAAEPDRNSPSKETGLLQSGDKATLCIAFCLLATGAILASLGAIMIVRKHAFSSK